MARRPKEPMPYATDPYANRRPTQKSVPNASRKVKATCAMRIRSGYRRLRLRGRYQGGGGERPGLGQAHHDPERPIRPLDRFLLCSDGVHGAMTDDRIAELLRERSAPDDTAKALVAAALDADSPDNCTALVLDAVALPTAASADVGGAIMQLPLIPTPAVSETIDGFALKALISDGRYSRLFGAQDEVEGGEAALKFPKPQVAAVATHHAAFAREAWVGAHVHSPWVAQILEAPR